MLRVKGPTAGPDATTSESPGSARTPSGYGAFSGHLARQDSGEYGNFGDLLSAGNSSTAGGGSSPYGGRGNSGAAAMLGNTGWQNGAFQGSISGGGAASAASPLGISSSSTLSSAPSSGATPGYGRGSLDRGYAMVKRLVAAVRSRNDAQLESVLSEYRGGGGHLLNERSPTTDRTALHEAVNLGSVDMVHMLLAAGSDPNIGHPKEGPPLLQVGVGV